MSIVAYGLARPGGPVVTSGYGLYAPFTPTREWGVPAEYVSLLDLEFWVDREFDFQVSTLDLEIVATILERPFYITDEGDFDVEGDSQDHQKFVTYLVLPPLP